MNGPSAETELQAAFDRLVDRRIRAAELIAHAYAHGLTVNPQHVDKYRRACAEIADWDEPTS